ncbi:hypothetical protein Tco_1341449, partial [Tanacetum coccineum]
MQLSCDELSIKATSLESQRDGLIDQVSSLEIACSGLRDQVLGYELVKEKCEAIQDVHVKELSDHVAGLESELMALALQLNEEFYPRFLTTIYAVAFGVVIGLSIDKGIQTGLVAGMDHGKAGRGLADVAAYDPSVEARYKLKEGAISYHTSICDATPFLVDPLSSENLIGEASTSKVPATAAATTTLSISVTATSASSIPPILVADYDVLDARIQGEVPHSPKIVFEKETLETT